MRGKIRSGNLRSLSMRLRLDFSLFSIHCIVTLEFRNWIFEFNFNLISFTIMGSTCALFKFIRLIFKMVENFIMMLVQMMMFISGIFNKRVVSIFVLFGYWWIQITLILFNLIIRFFEINTYSITFFEESFVVEFIF